MDEPRERGTEMMINALQFFFSAFRLTCMRVCRWSREERKAIGDVEGEQRKDYVSVKG